MNLYKALGCTITLWMVLFIMTFSMVSAQYQDCNVYGNCISKPTTSVTPTNYSIPSNSYTDSKITGLDNATIARTFTNATCSGATPYLQNASWSGNSLTGQCVAGSSEASVYNGNKTINGNIYSNSFIEKDMIGDYSFDDNASDLNGIYNSQNSPTLSNGRLFSYMNMTQYINTYKSMNNVTISLNWQGVDTTNVGNLAFSLSDPTKDILLNPRGWNIWLGDQSTGAVVFTMYNTAGTAIINWRSVTSYNDFSWNHLVLICDSSGLKVYINNNLKVGTFLTGNVNTPCNMSSTGNGVTEATIGGIKNINGYVYSGKQYIDNLKIYNRSLTISEVMKTQNKDRHSPNIFQLNNLGNIGFQGIALTDTFLRMYPTVINGIAMQKIFDYRTDTNTNLINEIGTNYAYQTIWSKEYGDNMRHFDYRMDITRGIGSGTSFPGYLENFCAGADYPTEVCSALHINVSNSLPPSIYQQAIVLDEGNMWTKDYYGVTFGTGKNAYILYNSTDLVIKPNNVGTGKVYVKGSQAIDNNLVILGNLSVKRPFFSSYDNSTQASLGVTSANIINISNNADMLSWQMSVVNRQNLTFQVSGVYRCALSPEFATGIGMTADLGFWYQKNGVDVVWTNSRYSIASLSYNAPAIEFIFEIRTPATDNIRFMWYSSNAGTTLYSSGALTNPTRPSVPAIMLKCNKVSEIL